MLSLGFVKRYRDYFRYVRKYLNADTSGLSPDERRKVVDNLIETTSDLAFFISLNPIPFADVLPLTMAQALMVRAIANLHGRRLSARAALELVATGGAGLAGRTLFRQIAKTVMPLAGSVGAGAFSYAWTWSLGQAARKVFESDLDLTADALRERMRGRAAEAMQRALARARRQPPSEQPGEPLPAPDAPRRRLLPWRRKRPQDGPAPEERAD